MTYSLVHFGNPERFQASLTWLPRDEPVERLPRQHGWSMGALTFTVAGENLMACRVRNQIQDSFIWYLGPLLHWIATNWINLLHEEHFPWPERSEDAAAMVCNRAISRFATIGKGAEELLETTEAWYHRHGLASAASGGLFRDIFLRRFADDVEISWTAAPPPYAPEDFTFEIASGLARLSISDVAEPLWEMLSWVKDNPPALETDTFYADWINLTQAIDAINNITPNLFDSAIVANPLLTRIQTSFAEADRRDLLKSCVASSGRYVTAEAPAVAMFGGLSVNLSNRDISLLRDILIASSDGKITKKLSALTKNAPLRGKPWQDGYDLAEDFLDYFEDQYPAFAQNEFVDIQKVCNELSVLIEYESLDTSSIRGIALAGVGFAPMIMINLESSYNHNDEGRRFTIAHELCHILHDQSRARRIAHVSGPWASPGVEKRANAFAAWLLMPPRLLKRYPPLNTWIGVDSLREIADSLHVTAIALTEHLFNLGLIDEIKREDLREKLHH